MPFHLQELLLSSNTQTYKHIHPDPNPNPNPSYQSIFPYHTNKQLSTSYPSTLIHIARYTISIFTKYPRWTLFISQVLTQPALMLMMLRTNSVIWTKLTHSNSTNSKNLSQYVQAGILMESKSSYVSTSSRSLIGQISASTSTMCP